MIKTKDTKNTPEAQEEYAFNRKRMVSSMRQAENHILITVAFKKSTPKRYFSDVDFNGWVDRTISKLMKLRGA